MNNGHWGADWTGAAFWIFIAACVVAGTWEKIRRNAEKHETMRIMIEKTGTVDEAKLKQLFSQSGSDWGSGRPGDGYRALRIIGTIVGAVGVALAILFTLMGQFGVMERNGWVAGVCIAFAVAFVGLALFWSSRFTQPPSQ